MNLKRVILAVAMGTTFAACAYEVENVTARSRFPWNGLVDIDYEITGAKSGEAFAIDVTANYSNGVCKLVGHTYKGSPIAGAGQNHLVWDMGADCPNVFAPDMKVAVSATPFGDKTPVYCVIDLSGGKDAEKYPVRYTTAAPVHSPKANDVCKTTELWFRRIRPASQDFAVGTLKEPADDNTSFYTRLTKDYYMAIFEMTQQQWFQLTGEWPSAFSNEQWRATRPVQRVIPSDLRGSWNWPDTKDPTEGSVLKKLRDRTGLATIDLPTEAQFQYAVNPGPTFGSSIYRYYKPDGSKRCTANECARTSANVESKSPDDLCGPESGTACVGTYLPNSLGLYDLLGNMWEYCIDPYVPLDKFKQYYIDKGVSFPILDPIGLPRADVKSLNSNHVYITVRCGGYGNAADYSVLTQRKGDSSSTRSNSYGFRLCITCE